MTKKKASKNLLFVRISNAKGTIWEGEAQSVSSENTEGPFDVLPMHANFITLIEKKQIRIVDREGEEHVYTPSNAVMFVHKDQVRIYTEIQ